MSECVFCRKPCPEPEFHPSIPNPERIPRYHEECLQEHIKRPDIPKERVFNENRGEYFDWVRVGGSLIGRPVK